MSHKQRQLIFVTDVEEAEYLYKLSTDFILHTWQHWTCYAFFSATWLAKPTVAGHRVWLPPRVDPWSWHDINFMTILFWQIIQCTLLVRYLPCQVLIFVGMCGKGILTKTTHNRGPGGNKYDFHGLFKVMLCAPQLLDTCLSASSYHDHYMKHHISKSASWFLKCN